jgi:glycerophosphoryl diester phosphodiesterase
MASTIVSLRLFSNDTSGFRPLIIAHRAGAERALENTLAALEIAVGDKADWAEIDVQRTADGVVVVAHDADLLRTAGHSLRIGQTPYAMLARIDVGKRFDDAFAGERVPTLADFLERAEERIKLLIELKYHGFDPQLAEETVSLVRRYNMAENVAIMSFDLEGVRQVQRLAPDIPVGYVAAAGVGNLARLDVEFVAIARRRANSKLIRQTQRRGLLTYAWTVNDADDMLDLMEHGIDGLITDDPALAGETIRYIRALTPPERVLLRLRHLWAPDRN